MNSQEIANVIMDIEQKNYPYYLVSEIEIIEYFVAVTADGETKIKYRVTISSKLDPKYNIQSAVRTIEISKILEYYRDNIIEKILE